MNNTTLQPANANNVLRSTKARDWIQSAIEEKRVDYFDFNQYFHDNPVLIAKGGFAHIYLATGKKRSKKYILKYLYSFEQPMLVDADEAGYQSFINELKLLRKVDDEDFVARCYGISRDPRTNAYILVMKYAENGSLSDYLKKSVGHFTWIDKLTLAFQIAEALDYIHDKGVIHRDLHSGNILVKASGKAVLADFGLSRPSSSKTSKLRLQGNIPYIPPERLVNPRKPKKHDARGDIYSLGVVFWEISGDGATPFPDSDFLTAIQISQGARETPIEGTPVEYVKLYTECWDNNPDKRPKLEDILDRLRHMLDWAKVAYDSSESPDHANEPVISGDAGNAEDLVTSPATTNEVSEIDDTMANADEDNTITVNDSDSLETYKPKPRVDSGFTEFSAPPLSEILSASILDFDIAGNTRSNFVIELKELQNNSATYVDFHMSKPWLLVCDYWNNNVIIWDLEARNENAFVVGDKNGKLSIFNYTSHKRVGKVAGHRNARRCITFHETAPIVLTSSDDGMIRQWDYSTPTKWTLTTTHRGHSKAIHCIAFNPKDPDMFATASNDRTVKIWTVKRHGSVLWGVTPFWQDHSRLTLKGHENNVNSVVWHHGSQPFIISGSYDKTIKIWNYETGECVQTLSTLNSIKAMCIHPEIQPSVLISGCSGGTISIWQADEEGVYIWKDSLDQLKSYGLVCSIACKRGSDDVAVGLEDAFAVFSLREQSASPVVHSKRQSLYSLSGRH
ncbi:kinase-like domain-containing protein [Jimgerdemannia flammicorona]|uniref:Kinase-like domain-containing protein n=1 Tax=Jimgerdemannia flammicorona TaxID=994334 RepID=A0A433QJ29_9FUNG|nr:kinase-like domain-containing protein [Jimgerdemannia flammicorona]